MKTPHFGWIPDVPDQRDHILPKAAITRAMLPSAVNLIPKCPLIYDQGQLGSCTANAVAGAVEFDQIKQRTMSYVPSRLFIYYNTRVIQGTVGYDSGASIRDSIKSLNKSGYCKETVWPYRIASFKTKPPAKAYSSAVKVSVSNYSRVTQAILDFKTVLASGFPITFGFAVYQSFMSVGSPGLVPMPKAREKMIGGHAVVICGYNDTTKRFAVRNSWGAWWGKNGYCFMPYAYLLSENLAADFWVVNYV